MEDDPFLTKMKGVKPITKENKIKPKKTKVENKANKTTSVLSEINREKIAPKSQYNLSFGEINKDLKKGKIKIDRRLDLHGYSLLDAHNKFQNEIKKAYGKNKRCLLVITGKGVHPNKTNEELTPRLFHGKIKNSIISWINDEEMSKYILTYQNASFEHGGDGAIFVYLRKKRN